MSEVAADVERVAAADEWNEVDLLPRQQRTALRRVEGGPAERARDPVEAQVKLVQLLEVTAGGGDEERRQGCQQRSTSSRVERMLRALEAPKTIERTLGSEQTHSIASCGGIAPEAKTDIAIARKRRSRSASS